MSHSRLGFQRKPLYKVKKTSALMYTKQKLTFVVAVLSIFAFVMGNLVGQNGWYGFMKAVFGKDISSTIVFTGTVPPIAMVPDYQAWAEYGGDKRLHTFAQAPQSVLRPLPAYDPASLASDSSTSFARQVYSTLWAGGYSGGPGSHGGVDIDAPRGTPVQSIANGVVETISRQSVGFGNSLVIRHPNVPDPANPGSFTTVYSTYAHLDTLLVYEGQVVNKGQTIATVGNTGFVMGATGYHLLFNIDTDSAPFHPYWPFTAADSRQAGLTFVQAVNSTLFRDRLYQYTLSPMLFVQQYSNYSGTQIAKADTTQLHSAANTMKNMTIQERIAARRAKRLAAQQATQPVDSTTSSAPPVVSSAWSLVGDSVPLPPANTVSSSIPLLVTAQQNAVTAATPVPVTTVIHHLAIEHDGSFSHGWQKIAVVALDANGERVLSPSFSSRLFVVPTFGEALIRPSNELKASDFVKGVAVLNILPKDGAKTLIFETKSDDEALSNVVSAPMAYEK